MKRAALLVLVLTACKKTTPSVPTDAGVTTAVTKDFIADASVDAAPIVDDAFHVVARGTPASKVIWLKVLGQRVWLSAQSLDAFADGDGPLVRGSDPFAKLPYKPGLDMLQVAGAWPHLYVLRSTKVQGRMASPVPTPFVYQSNGEWKEATWAMPRPISLTWYPHAFIPYRDGALLVSGQVELNNPPYYSAESGPGTLLRLVTPEGTIIDPHIDVHPLFLAFNGDSDNDTLALLGTIAVNDKRHPDLPNLFDVNGVHVARIADGKGKTTAIMRGTWPTFQMPYLMKIREQGDRTIVSSAVDGNIWIVDANGKMTMRNVPAGKGSPGIIDASVDYDCRLFDAALVGDDVYAIRRCTSTATTQLYRVTADNKATPVVLEEGCAPESPLAVRAPADLWVQAKCTKGPAVFRLGRAQTVVTIP